MKGRLTDEFKDRGKGFEASAILVFANCPKTAMKP
jgi:hypothetical protein